MKRIFLLLLVTLLLLSSCSLERKIKISVSLYSELTWEEVTGEPMWYLVKYFDGESVKTKYLGKDEKKFSLLVSPTSLSVFALYPLGNLSPFGGFYERGNEKKVYLLPEYGYFASMLIDAALVMPHSINELSVSSIKKDYPDLGIINRESFLSSLYQGQLEERKIKLSKLYKVPLDGVLKGYWISLFSHNYSFVLASGNEDLTLSLFPGVWYYLCVERKMILEVVITDSGEYWTKLKAMPKWI